MQAFFFIICCLLTIEVNGQGHIIDTPCMTDYVLVNMDSTLGKVEEIKYCYDRIPDFRRTVIGHNLKMDCYINEYAMLVNKSVHSINRCGEWMEVVGPSQSPIMCMIAGSFKISIPGTNPDLHFRMIGVKSSDFHYVTAGMYEKYDLLSQVTMAETDFNLRTNPTVYVLEKNDTHATIQYINHNRPPERMAVVTKEKYEGLLMNYDNTFTVKILDGPMLLHLISFDNEINEFKNVDLKNGTVFKTEDRFVSYNLTSCKYFADTEIFVEGKNYSNTINMFRWQMWHIDNNNEAVAFPLEENFVNFETISDPVSTCFLYPTALMMNQDFRELRMDFRCSDVKNYKFLQTDLYFNNEIMNLNTSTLKLISSGLKTQYYIDEDGITIRMRIAFNASNYEFANFVKITHSVPIGTTLSLINASLVRSRQYSKQLDCEHSTFDCLFIQCTIKIASDLNPWKEGCQPTCGSCRIGFTCNETGFCNKQENMNLRSNSLMISVCLLLISILMLI